MIGRGTSHNVAAAAGLGSDMHWAHRHHPHHATVTAERARVAAAVALVGMDGEGAREGAQRKE